MEGLWNFGGGGFEHPNPLPRYATVTVLVANLMVNYETYGMTYAAAAWRHLKGKNERMIGAKGIKRKDELLDQGEIMIKKW